jgi:hypothetical protein
MKTVKTVSNRFQAETVGALTEKYTCQEGHTADFAGALFYVDPRIRRSAAVTGRMRLTMRLRILAEPHGGFR